MNSEAPIRVWFVFSREQWRRAQAVTRSEIVRIIGVVGARLVEMDAGREARSAIGPVERWSIAADRLRQEFGNGAIAARETYRGPR